MSRQSAPISVHASGCVARWMVTYSRMTVPAPIRTPDGVPGLNLRSCGSPPTPAPGAQLGAGVRIGPYAIVGADVTIGDEAEIAGHAVLEGRGGLGQRVSARPARHAEATRRAVRAWGLEILCLNPPEYSSSLTAVLMPQGHSEADFRKAVLEHFNMSLGQGLGKVAGKVFRIGHLGDFNDLMLMGTLAGVEMGLELAGVPHQQGGVAAAMDYLIAAKAAPDRKQAAKLGVA